MRLLVAVSRRGPELLDRIVDEQSELTLERRRAGPNTIADAEGSAHHMFHILNSNVSGVKAIEPFALEQVNETARRSMSALIVFTTVGDNLTMFRRDCINVIRSSSGFYDLVAVYIR